MLAKALGEINITEREAGAVTDRVREYLRAVNIDASERVPYWGGAWGDYLAEPVPDKPPEHLIDYSEARP